MLRIATIGTSAITESFIEAIDAAPEACFAGTLSRSEERARAFSEEHGGNCFFTSIEDLAASAEVDAVYIGSPNACHHDQALACIRGGKHVLVEKPFCATEAEALEVFRAAEAANVVALEAMRPLHDRALWVIEDALGELGRIRRASFRFGKYSSRYDEVLAGRATNIFDCNMASGALMDIGVYTVEPMVEIFGMPQTLTCAGALLGEETQATCNGPIDGAGTILAGFGTAEVELSYSKITNDLLPSQIEGELGTLTVDRIATPGKATVSRRVLPEEREGGTGYSDIDVIARELELPQSNNSMEYELADFICAIENAPKQDDEIWAAPANERRVLGHYRDVTLVSLRVMDAARAQMGVRFPADDAPAGE